jgi:hypothetical protein
MKKIIGIIIIGLVIITLIPGGTATLQKIAEKHPEAYTSKLIGIGFVRINPTTYEIKGFVLIGIHDGHALIVQNIDITYDGSPIKVGGLVPFLFTIQYNPA